MNNFKIYQTAKHRTFGNKACLCDLHVEVVLGGFRSEFDVDGLARCSPEDTFDEIKGQRLAESRASMKAYKKIWDMLNDLGSMTLDIAELIDKSRTRLDDIVCKESKHLETLEK